MLLLESKNYHQLLEPIKKVTINNLFALSVLEQRMPGFVYINDANDPKTFYIVHPYGMSLLFGDCSNKVFNAKLRDYALNKNKTPKKQEWMQAFPNAWHDVLKDLFGTSLINSSDNSEKSENNVIELNTRVNFRFNLEKYCLLKQDKPAGVTIVRTNEKIFAEMKGAVVPSFFWNDAADFYKNGIGFSLFEGDKLASTSYSAFIQGNMLEIGLETVEEFRGKGYAQNTCTALIDYCLKNNFEPVWACRLENIGSYKLAVKLGFEPTLKIPYYKLCR